MSYTVATEDQETQPPPSKSCRDAVTSYLVEPDARGRERQLRVLTGCVTVINLLALSLEVGSTWPHWWKVNAVFLLYYTVEFSLRYFHFGVVGWSTASVEGIAISLGHVIDALLILLGAAEVYLALVAPHMLGRVALSLECARLLRALRLFRQFEILAKFVSSLVELVPSLVWIFGVMTLIWYVVALGIQLYVNTLKVEDDDLSEARYRYFQDVSTTMFTLFQVITVDKWAKICESLAVQSPTWRIFFMVFIGFLSWIMISVLTGTISDTFISNLRRTYDEEGAKNQAFINFLADAFNAADANQNGVLDREEFHDMVESDVVQRRLADMGAFIDREGLHRVFDMLDVHKAGTLTRSMFVEGLLQFQQTLGTKQVMSVDYALQRMHLMLMNDSMIFEGKVDQATCQYTEITRQVDAMRSLVDGLRQEVQVQLMNEGLKRKSSRERLDEETLSLS
eukprot:TRINITY_DN21957_c0_g1_i1.p1 TRINITY_DN21957_c0_g1~~TRINITY_DN21957_c0_g1_i1.p1  ORF type:complete len:453 (-),score=101.70 TRINITY_DN21957_c0_g1_i1:77-1435(-)